MQGDDRIDAIGQLLAGHLVEGGRDPVTGDDFCAECLPLDGRGLGRLFRLSRRPRLGP